MVLTNEEKLLIEAKIKNIIESVDVNTCSTKQIRQELQASEGINLSDDKDWVNNTVMKALEMKLSNSQTLNDQVDKNIDGQSSPDDHIESSVNDYELARTLQQQENDLGRKDLRQRRAATSKKYLDGSAKFAKKPRAEAEDGKSASSPSRKGRPLNKALLLSDALKALFGDEYDELTRPECVKKIWEYIRANDLQDPKDKRMIVCDEKLQAVFKRGRVSCFGMNKYLSAHLRRKDDIVGEVEKQANGNEGIDSEDEVDHDSDEDQSDQSSTKPRISAGLPGQLLAVPGVGRHMTFPAIQAAILAYTQAKGLRDPVNVDNILLRANDPVTSLMERPSGESVHLLELLERVRELYGKRK